MEPNAINQNTLNQPPTPTLLTPNPEIPKSKSFIRKHYLIIILAFLGLALFLLLSSLAASPLVLILALLTPIAILPFRNSKTNQTEQKILQQPNRLTKKTNLFFITLNIIMFLANWGIIAFVTLGVPCNDLSCRLTAGFLFLLIFPLTGIIFTGLIYKIHKQSKNEIINNIREIIEFPGYIAFSINAFFLFIVFMGLMFLFKH